MNADERRLIRTYFELLKKHYDNNPYTSLESIKNSLEEELLNYTKQLRAAEKVFLEIESFLSHPVPIPPFVTKELIKILIDEIRRDLNSIYSKILSNLERDQIHINIAIQRRILLYVGLFFLTCIILAYIITNLIRSYYHILIIVFFIFIYIYFYIKLKSLSSFYEFRIFALKERCQRKQDEIELIETQIRASKIYNLEDLEDKIKQLLEEDKQNLIDLGMKRLKTELLDREPILSLNGINSNDKLNSHILITDRGIEKIENKYKILLIQDDDFYEEKGIDGIYRYGVYECFVIFLGETSLSYYRCYWNFIKGAAVDEETCEYLYDSIVSVKTKERSSLRLQNPDHKRKYRDLLSLTTMDGKIVYFEMSDDKQKQIYSGSKRVSDYVSDLDQAAACIRFWLRHQRVDYQLTKDIDK